MFTKLDHFRSQRTNVNNCKTVKLTTNELMNSIEFRRSISQKIYTCKLLFWNKQNFWPFYEWRLDLNPHSRNHWSMGLPLVYRCWPSLTANLKINFIKKIQNFTCKLWSNQARSGITVVDPWTADPEIGGSNPAAAPIMKKSNVYSKISQQVSKMK